MIGWAAIGLMALGLFRPNDSKLGLALWSAALACMLLSGAWPVNIALSGVVVGALFMVVKGPVA